MDQLPKIATDRNATAAELAALNVAGGFDSTLGLVYTQLGPTQARAEIEVDKRHLQPFGIVNGGVFSALAESVGSLYGVLLAGGVPVSGVNNDTNFLRAVRSGRIEAVATALQAGRRTQVIEVAMYQGERLVAKSTLRTLVLHEQAS